VAVERECLRLALQRGTPAQFDEAQAFLQRSRRMPADTPMAELVALDEGFHQRLAAMSGNAELQRMLASLNERIRFIRWIDMEHVGRDSTQQEHQAILRPAPRDGAAPSSTGRAHRAAPRPDRRGHPPGAGPARSRLTPGRRQAQSLNHTAAMAAALMPP
jgi:DNA-binding GntR family transcriptional regulator